MYIPYTTCTLITVCLNANVIKHKNHKFSGNFYNSYTEHSIFKDLQVEGYSALLFLLQQRAVWMRLLDYERVTRYAGTNMY